MMVPTLFTTKNLVDGPVVWNEDLERWVDAMGVPVDVPDTIGNRIHERTRETIETYDTYQMRIRAKEDRAIFQKRMLAVGGGALVLFLGWRWMQKRKKR